MLACLNCFRGWLIFCLVLVVLVGGVLFCDLFGSFFVVFSSWAFLRLVGCFLWCDQVALAWCLLLFLVFGCVFDCALVVPLLAPPPSGKSKHLLNYRKKKTWPTPGCSVNVIVLSVRSPQPLPMNIHCA